MLTAPPGVPTDPMQFAELAPHPLLRPFVGLIWCAEFDSSEALAPPERIAPDGIVELVFHYRNRMALASGTKGFEPAPRTAVVCQSRLPIDIRPDGPTGLVSVRFQPWGGQHFMDLPVSALADSVIPAEAIWKSAVAETGDRLAGARNQAERVALVEDFLIDQLGRHQKIDVEPAIRAIWQCRGNVRIPALGRKLGVSDRTLHRVLTHAVGMSPKAYARLTRFLGACETLRGTAWESLADVAALSGYYDQAHFSTEFRRYAGMTPGQFLTCNRFSFLPVG